MPQIYQLAGQYFPDIRITIGRINVAPNAINTIPGELRVSVDIRHPSIEILNEAEKRLREICAGRGGELSQIWQAAPVHFDQAAAHLVERATLGLGYTHQKIISGAGHDAAYLAQVVPTAMIFIPCQDGLSHNELENISREDAGKGANVLLHAILLASSS